MKKVKIDIDHYLAMADDLTVGENVNQQFTNSEDDKSAAEVCE